MNPDTASPTVRYSVDSMRILRDKLHSKTYRSDIPRAVFDKLCELEAEEIKEVILRYLFENIGRNKEII